jgi:pimeloyl-ACP methyl ester carboxylesterase
LTTLDGAGELDLYFVPGHGDNAQITVIYNHGNYAGLEHYMPRVRFLHEGGYSVLFWDYRGYGKSEPAAAPTAQQWLQDAHQVRNAAEDYAPDPTRIAIYANSVGGIPSVEMALYAPGCALVLEAPFTGISAITRDNAGIDFPATYLTYGDFENTEKIADYAGPLFTMIGTEDNKFSVEEVTLLHDNAGTPAADKELWVLDGVGHGISGGGIPEAGLADYLGRIDVFLGQYCAP